MKKLMLMACGAFFVLMQTATGQDNLNKNDKQKKTWARKYFEKQSEGVAVLKQNPNPSTYHDTLVINLRGNDKIFLIGKNFLQMVEFKNVDLLKMLFLNDFEKAVSENSLSIDVQMVHYFVHKSGKRRLKAENPEYTDNKVDIAYEIKRLNQDLPKYRYIIHNLHNLGSSDPFNYRGEFELHIYISNPEELRNILSNISIDDVLHNIRKEDWRRSYKLEINTDHNDYQVVKKMGNKNVINPFGLEIDWGAGLFGNTIAPVFGGDYGLLFTNKYYRPNTFLGLGLHSFPIVQIGDGKITDVNMVYSYDLKWMMREIGSDFDKRSWDGLHAGIMKSNNMTPFNNAFKWGVSVSKRGFVFSFDKIKDRDGNKFYSFTVTVGDF